ncbi:hypothetical protein SprV_0401645600 [Sparganum proliferum]
MKRKRSNSPANLCRTAPPPDHHLLPPVEAGESSVEASPIAALRTGGLCSHPEARSKLDKLLEELLVSDNKAIEETKGCKLQTAIHPTALDVLDRARRRHQNRFDGSDANIS